MDKKSPQSAIAKKLGLFAFSAMTLLGVGQASAQQKKSDQKNKNEAVLNANGEISEWANEMRAQRLAREEAKKNGTYVEEEKPQFIVKPNPYAQASNNADDMGAPLAQQDKILKALYQEKTALERELSWFYQTEAELDFYNELYRAGGFVEDMKRRPDMFPLFDLNRVKKNPGTLVKQRGNLTRGEAAGGVLYFIDLALEMPEEDIRGKGIDKARLDKVGDKIWDDGYGRGIRPSMDRIYKLNQERDEERYDARKARHMGRRVQNNQGLNERSAVNSEIQALQGYVYRKVMALGNVNQFYRVFDVAAEKTWDLRETVRHPEYRADRRELSDRLDDVERQIKAREKDNRTGYHDDVDIDIDVENKAQDLFKTNITELAHSDIDYQNNGDHVMGFTASIDKDQKILRLHDIKLG